MDEMVKAAMAKWPHVPHCYGWLGLDARGQWWMRDDAAQAAGPFMGEGANPQSRGVLLSHTKLVDFIGRNYAADERGCWYFQNGPQRVYVELEYTPWVWRLEVNRSLMTHTGKPVQVKQWFEDRQGRLVGLADCGWGVLHSQDMVRFVDGMGEMAIQQLPQAMWMHEPKYCRSPSTLQRKREA